MPQSGELRQSWPVIVACFATAVVGWGFGFYGLSAYVAQLRLERGWSTAFTSGATMGYYLFSAVLLTRAPAVVQRFGPRPVLLGGCLGMAAGAVLAGQATAPWHLVAAFVVMGAGWAGTSVAALAATIGLWFDQRRGLAMSLALNGASVAGFTIAPALVWLADRDGLARATMTLAIVALVIVVPLIVFGTSRPRLVFAAAAPVVGGDVANQRAALRSLRFWGVAGPFALMIMAQVGLVVHLVSLLLPVLGAAGAGLAMGTVAICAVLGRLALGVVVDRVDQRMAAAVGIAVQIAGLALMLALPGEAWALYAGCVLFGVSVGNNITLPPLILQRTFGRASFGMVVGLYSGLAQVGYAFTPGLFGVVHDLTGGYGAVLALAIAMKGTGAVLLLAPR